MIQSVVVMPNYSTAQTFSAQRGRLVRDDVGCSTLHVCGLVRNNDQVSDTADIGEWSVMTVSYSTALSCVISQNDARLYCQFSFVVTLDTIANNTLIAVRLDELTI